GDACEIAARTIKAPHQSELDRISARSENDWYVPRRRFGSQCHIAAYCDDRCRPSAYQLSGKRWQPFDTAVHRVVLDRHVAALCKADLRQTPEKRLDKLRRRFPGWHVEPDDDRLRPLLGPDKERPPSRATEPRDEIPASHSITSSASASSMGGTDKPS